MTEVTQFQATPEKKNSAVLVISYLIKWCSTVTTDKQMSCFWGVFTQLFSGMPDCFPNKGYQKAIKKVAVA